jgi:GxxExxY protein
MAYREPDKEVDDLARQVIGAAIEVHRHLGPGYLESVYEEALAIELDLRGLPFERQKPIGVDYKGHVVGQGRLDLLVGDRLIVELKAVDTFAPIHRAQVISYLKATGLHLGLLINFNVQLLRDGVQRIVLS